MEGPPPVTEVHKSKPRVRTGSWVLPLWIRCEKEVERARGYYAGLKAEDKLHLVVERSGPG